VKTQQAGKGLAGAVAISIWRRLAVVLYLLVVPSRISGQQIHSPIQTPSISHTLHVTSGVRSRGIGNCIGSLYRHTMEMEQMMTHMLAITKAEIRTEKI
jgi:hypothetical protein